MAGIAEGKTIIDTIHRDKILNDPMRKLIEGKSDEELRAMLGQLEQMQAKEMQVNTNRDRLGSAAGYLGDIFLQRGGIQPPKKDTGNDLNDFMMKEMIKQRLQPKTAQDYLAELELKNVLAGQQSSPETTTSPVKTTPINATPTIEPSLAKETTPFLATGANKENIPSMYIQKPKGKNKYGIMEYETVENPEYKSALEIKTEKGKKAKNPEDLLKNINSAYNAIGEIEKSGLLNKGNIGMFGGINFPGTPKITLKAKVEQLKSLLTLPKLEEMRGFGVLSDRDVEMLKSSVTALDYSMPVEDFKKELQKIRGALTNSKLKLKGIENLPIEIKTTSQAVEYLMGQGISQEEAIDWLRNQ